MILVAIGPLFPSSQSPVASSDVRSRSGSTNASRHPGLPRGLF